MPLLTPERKAELIASTKQQAIALLEDIIYIRTVVEKDNPSNGDIRRLSGLMRRIIVEADYAVVANPRAGKPEFIGPDNNSAYKVSRDRPFLFFMSGEAKIFGRLVGAMYSYDFAVPKAFAGAILKFPKVQTGAKVPMTLETFRKQNVISYKNRWVSRQSIIKYVANIGSGVHSGNELSEEDKFISNVRNAARISQRDDGVHIDLFPNGVGIDIDTFQHTPNAIDPVLIELLAAATVMVKSPFTQSLEAALSAEFS